MIKSKKFKDWSPNTRRALLKATLPTGVMSKCIINKPETLTYAYYGNGNRIMGWLAVGVVPLNYKPTRAMMLYVKEQNRHKGIGKKLVKAALQNNKTYAAFTWDDTSTAFWNKMHNMFRNISPINVYDHYALYGGLKGIWEATYNDKV